mmetsp:Transcript_24462/g.36229  ORF Transcript_24462/g.36229 Transcript_24462/m.36229 type:complete len:240 (-) Transcript_24462:474-1193(-)
MRLPVPVRIGRMGAILNMSRLDNRRRRRLPKPVLSRLSAHRSRSNISSQGRIPEQALLHSTQLHSQSAFLVSQNTSNQPLPLLLLAAMALSLIPVRIGRVALITHVRGVHIVSAALPLLEPSCCLKQVVYNMLSAKRRGTTCPTLCLPRHLPVTIILLSPSPSASDALAIAITLALPHKVPLDGLNTEHLAYSLLFQYHGNHLPLLVCLCHVIALPIPIRMRGMTRVGSVICPFMFRIL